MSNEPEYITFRRITDPEEYVTRSDFIRTGLDFIVKPGLSLQGVEKRKLSEYDKGTVILRPEKDDWHARAVEAEEELKEFRELQRKEFRELQRTFAAMAGRALPFRP